MEERKAYRSICLLLAVLLVTGMLPGCQKKDGLPQGACYVIAVEKTDSSGKNNDTLTLIYDSGGKLLRYQDTDERIDYTYDARGNILTCRGYDLQANVPLDVIGYTYDGAGRLIKEEGYYITEDNSFCHTYHYDEQGNLVNHKQYSEGTLFMEWSYSSGGALLEQVYHAYDYRYQYTYAGDGKLRTVDYINSNGDGSASTKTEYVYGKGRKLVKKTQGSRGETLYTYDDSGTLVQKVHTDHTMSKITSYSYTYDLSGRLTCCVWKIEKIYGKKEESTSGRFWQYDDHGRMTQFGYIGADGSQSPKYTWHYDAAGNVTKLVCGETVYEFTYTWPKGELPQAVKESACAYIASFVMLDVSAVESYLEE